MIIITIIDLSIHPRVHISSHHHNHRRGGDVVLPQRNVVLARVEPRAVVVHVVQLYLHHGCGAQAACCQIDVINVINNKVNNVPAVSSPSLWCLGRLVVNDIQ